MDMVILRYAHRSCTELKWHLPQHSDKVNILWCVLNTGRVTANGRIIKVPNVNR